MSFLLLLLQGMAFPLEGFDSKIHGEFGKTGVTAQAVKELCAQVGSIQ